MILFAGAIALLSLFAPPRPARIIVLRHGEKPLDESNPHLSPEGVKRAGQLVAFITTDSAMTRLGPVAAIFATRTTKDDNGQRTQETVRPLAQALNLRIRTPWTGRQAAALAEAILANPKLAGKTILICWNHKMIPELVAALGVEPQPKKWPSGVFQQGADVGSEAIRGLLDRVIDEVRVFLRGRQVLVAEQAAGREQGVALMLGAGGERVSEVVEANRLQLGHSADLLPGIFHFVPSALGSGQDPFIR